ncbi:type III PLP-dependent enzyme [Streptomyces sp. NPDC002138]|uniref:type III PLP-dependent enzyme n=1 Tax=Streptomyces sp. NPDC002138 TaxID=3154410 RepID=UPI003323A705
MIPTPSVTDRIQSLDAAELPAYIYDLAALRAHAASIRAAVPAGVELYYAAKANPEAELLAALSPYVDGYEVSSGGELTHVAKAVPGRPLAFGGPGKTPAELTAALESGVARYHVESLHDLRMLADLSARTTPHSPIGVLLRVNLPLSEGSLAGSSLAMGGRPTPFGLDPADAETAAALLTADTWPHLELLGVHAHLASGLEAPDLVASAASIVTWSEKLAIRHGFALREVNVGGGMHVSYATPGVLFDWKTYGEGLARITAAHPGVTLRIEPGRAMTAYCGWYATEVLDVKDSHGEAFAVVRGGTHHLRTPATKGHDQPCSIVPFDPWPHPWPRPAGTRSEVTLSGQLCTPKDLLARRVPAPGLRAGDRVAFALAGAYAWNISHHDFLMHPHPTHHFLNP